MRLFVKCIVCSKKLTGKKRKYCSEKCYLKLRVPFEREHYRKHSPLLPNRNCIWCEKSFRPRGEVHVCCNRNCRTKLEQYKQREKRKQAPTSMHKWGKHGWVIRPDFIETTLTDEPMSLQNSEHKNEIEEYLAKGGKIESLPNQINGKTPDVNLNNLGGFSVETLYGFGYELQLMEELSSASEVGDAN